MTTTRKSPIEVGIVAVPETAGSALYGMVDVLSAVGNIWQTLVRVEPLAPVFDVRVVSPHADAFTCGNGIPVAPDDTVGSDPQPEIVIVPEIWLGPDESLHGKYSDLMDWIKRRHAAGAYVYSACSGAVLLAETGLLNGCEATSHWGYADMFRKEYPDVRFNPEPNLVFARDAPAFPGKRGRFRCPKGEGTGQLSLDGGLDPPRTLRFQSGARIQALT